VRWERLKLTRARLAPVTNTRPLVRRLTLRIRALGSPVNKGDLLSSGPLFCPLLIFVLRIVALAAR